MTWFVLIIFKKFLILSIGNLWEIGQKVFFEKRTAKIATTDSTFLSIIIGIYSESNFLIFFDVAKALYINSEYVNDLLLSKIIFLLGFFFKIFNYIRY